jgi:subtilase family serine protease
MGGFHTVSGARESVSGSLARAFVLLIVAGAFAGACADASALQVGKGLRAGASAPGRTLVANAISSEVAASRALGPADSASPEYVLIALQHRDQRGLLRFIARVSDPSSPMYEHYLTARQFVERYAPSPSTVSAVERFTRGFGLRVVAIPSNRAYVYAIGTVAEMERAFDTRIDAYALGGRTVHAPGRKLSVPSRLAGMITAVDGLDTADVATPQDTPPLQATVNPPPDSAFWGQLPATQLPPYDGKVFPYTDYGYTPQQIEGAYGISKAIAHGLSGKGQTVAVIDAYSSPTIVSDVDTWSAMHGLPKPKLTIDDTAAERDQPQVPPALSNSYNQGPQFWFGEETLDIEAVHAMAPGASIIMQGAASSSPPEMYMAQNAVVSADKAQIISNSYGFPPGLDSPTSDGYWEQAAAQGIGVYFSSGDNGDGTDGGANPADRAVGGGPDSPYVTAVGGTTLAVGRHDNYEFETYWGTDSATLTDGKWGPASYLSGGGGGTSEAYAEPAYQKPVVPARLSSYWRGNPHAKSGATIPGRVVPDVAVIGDESTGLEIGLTQDFTAYLNPQSLDLPGDTDRFAQYGEGGTSLASPVFAAMMALADQAAGKSLGFANRALYRLYKTGAFHDITAPKSKVAVVGAGYLNGVNASGGVATAVHTTGVTGTLSSVPGYDDSTGLGSPTGLAFLSALAPGSRLIATICPSPTGNLSGTTLGLLNLGDTRAQAKRADPDNADRGKYTELFCVTRGRIRVDYASPKLLDALPTSQRRRYARRVILISTANPYYASHGIRPGATVKAARRRLKLGAEFAVGRNDWYFAPAGAATAVLGVRRGVVQEIGIADKGLTHGRAAQLRFLNSLQ